MKNCLLVCVLLCGLLCTLKGQFRVEANLLQNISVCDTAKLLLIVENLGDTTILNAVVDIEQASNKLNYSGFQQNAFINSVLNAANYLTITISNLPGCQKREFEFYFVADCESENSFEKVIVRYVSDGVIFTNDPIEVFINTPDILLVAGQWSGLDNDTITLELEIINIGQTDLSSIRILVDAKAGKVKLLEGDIGELIGLDTLYFNSEDLKILGLSGGILHAGTSVQLQINFLRLECVPGLLTFTPLLICEDVICTSFAPAIKFSENEKLKSDMYGDVMDFNTCNAVPYKLVFKNNSNQSIFSDNHFYDLKIGMDFQDLNQENFLKMLDCLEMKVLTVNGTSVLTDYEIDDNYVFWHLKNYNINGLSDLDGNGFSGDLARGDSLEIELSIFLQDSCWLTDQGLNSKIINALFAQGKPFKIKFRDFCKQEFDDSAFFRPIYKFELDGMNDGFGKPFNHGEKVRLSFISLYHSLLVECTEVQIKINVEMTEYLRFNPDQSKLVLFDGKGIIEVTDLDYEIIGTELIIHYLGQRSLLNAFLEFTAECTPGELLCKTCASQTVKEFAFEVIIKCNGSCPWERVTDTYNRNILTTCHSQENSMYALSLSNFKAQRKSAGFKDAMGNVPIDSETDTIVHRSAFAGDTVTYAYEMGIHCLDMLESIYINCMNAESTLCNLTDPAISIVLNGFNRQTKQSTGICHAQIIPGQPVHFQFGPNHCNLDLSTDSVYLEITRIVNGARSELNIVEFLKDSCRREYSFLADSMPFINIRGFRSRQISMHSFTSHHSANGERDSFYVNKCGDGMTGVYLTGSQFELHREFFPAENYVAEYRPVLKFDQIVIQVPADFVIDFDKIGIYQKVSAERTDGRIITQEFEFIKQIIPTSNTVQGNLRTLRFNDNPEWRNTLLPFHLAHGLMIPYQTKCELSDTFNIFNRITRPNPLTGGSITIVDTLKVFSQFNSSKIDFTTQFYNGNPLEWKIDYQPFPIRRNDVSLIFSEATPENDFVIELQRSDPNIEIVHLLMSFPHVHDSDTIILLPEENSGMHYFRIPYKYSAAAMSWQLITANHSCTTDSLFIRSYLECVANPLCSDNLFQDTLVSFSHNPFPFVEWKEEQTTLSYCAENKILLEITNKGVSTLMNPYVGINLPEGLRINTIKLQSGEELDIEPPAGPTLFWKVLLHEFIDSLGSVLSYENNSFTLIFDLDLTCDFNAPQRLSAFLEGDGACGSSFMSRNQLRELTVSNGIPESEFDFQLITGRGENCKEETEILLKISPDNSSWTSNAGDSILFVFDGPFEYVFGSTKNVLGFDVPDPVITSLDNLGTILKWGNVDEFLSSEMYLLRFKVRHFCADVCQKFNYKIAYLQNFQPECLSCSRQFSVNDTSQLDFSLRPDLNVEVLNTSAEVIGGSSVRIEGELLLSSSEIGFYKGNAKVYLLNDLNGNQIPDVTEPFDLLFDGYTELDELNTLQLIFESDVSFSDFCQLKIVVILDELCLCEPLVFSLEGLLLGASEEELRICHNDTIQLDIPLLGFCTNNLHLYPNIFVKDGVLFYTGTLTDGQHQVSGIIDFNFECGPCAISKRLKIEIYKPAGYFEILNPISCFGGADGVVEFVSNHVNLMADWQGLNGSNLIQENLISGTYNLSVTDGAGCSAFYTFILPEPDSITITYAVSSPICSEHDFADLFFNISGGIPPFMVSWSDGQTGDFLIDIGFGEYEYTITDSNECQRSGTITFANNEIGQTNIQPVPASCEGKADGSIFLNLPPGTIVKFDGELVNDSIINGLAPGTYELHLLSTGNCESKMPVVITALSSFEVEVPDSLFGYLGNVFEIFPIVIPDGSYEFEWIPSEWVDQPNQQDILAQPMTSGFLKLIVQNSAGCVVSEEIFISLDSRIRVFVPDAFSPNGDGINDIFRPYTGDEVAEILNFDVFDRWGNHLYTLPESISAKADIGWDGKRSDQLMDPGVFVYNLKIRLINGDVYSYSGDFVLMR